MLDSVLVKIVRNDGKIFKIGRGSEWKLAQNGLDGFGSFDSNINFVDNGILDGGRFTNTHIGRVDRIIKAGYILPGNNEAIRPAVAMFFNSKANYDVHIEYMGRELWATAKVKQYNLSMQEAKNKVMYLTVAFSYEQPYLKSADDFGKNIASVTPAFGFPYMVRKDRGLTAGIFNFNRNVNLYNDGDIRTSCLATFTAKGTATNPTLHINDKYIRVIDVMQADDVIEMDLRSLPPTVKKNGVNFIGKCDRTSNFTDMHIEVGDNTIGFSTDNGDDQLDVTIRYNKLYSTI